ncbi:hypothetical protein PORY_000613 [Pneumocystis oryctolagi]|uniref:Uncharacterized protein n=1 Tax=Pneumocystis oryctolagi TaxID=42067 RepID=A0ACB7CFD9_9ASCO|nr:hypothetical protein PORY_000613 [Pneumocystis oryctolagi]
MSLMPFKIEKKEKTDDTETSASHPYKKYVSEQLTNESSSDISDKSQLECSYETSLSSSDIRVSYTTKKKSLELKKQSPDSNKFVTKNSLEFCKNKTPHNDVQNHVKIQKSSKKSKTLPTESFIENIPKSSKSKSNLSKSPFHHHVKQEKRISFQKDIIPSHLPNNELFDYNGSSNSTDDNDWDSVYDSSISSSPNENPLFQKIDTCLSKPQIQSRRSLLSCMLQDKSGKVLANSSSKSSPAISLSQTSASPIIYKQVTYNQHPVTNVPSTSPHVISPQMVRRNMFASELSESLRKNLLWERQQKSATMFNTLKCRHNTHKGEGIDKLSTQAHKENYYFFDDTDYGYNAAGW